MNKIEIGRGRQIVERIRRREFLERLLIPLSLGYLEAEALKGLWSKTQPRNTRASSSEPPLPQTELPFPADQYLSIARQVLLIPPLGHKLGFASTMRGMGYEIGELRGWGEIVREGIVRGNTVIVRDYPTEDELYKAMWSPLGKTTRVSWVAEIEIKNHGALEKWGLNYPPYIDALPHGVFERPSFVKPTLVLKNGRSIFVNPWYILLERNGKRFVDRVGVPGR